VDVRTPEELKFTGYAKDMDFHVPYILNNQKKYSAKKKSYANKKNKSFKTQLLTQLKKQGVTKDSNIIIMCRSGSTRAAPVVDMLDQLGYKKVYSMIDGFEGSKAKTGNIGARTVNGWKNSGGDWSYKIPKDKLWYKK
jgi:rhodanese-related sulfurtransferase